MRRTEERAAEAYRERFGEGPEVVASAPGRVREGDERRWADYPRGVVWALGESGREVGPFRAVFSGDVPQGAGLSSSAAIESATILALDALFGFGLDSERKEAALLCQRAENGYVGVRSGILDQYGSGLRVGGEGRGDLHPDSRRAGGHHPMKPDAAVALASRRRRGTRVIRVRAKTVRDYGEDEQMSEAGTPL